MSKTDVSKPNVRWGANVIIADADYVDRVAFDLTVNFERMIGRHIPPADMARWVECVALDGGCGHTASSPDSDGEPLTHVVLVHDARQTEMNNFNPGVYGDNMQSVAEDVVELSLLNGRAFRGEVGECEFITVSSDNHRESMTKADVVADILAAMADEPQVKRVMVVPDLDNDSNGMADVLLPVLRHIDRSCPEKRVTLFAMQPMAGIPCRTEILGYSLMAALGIRADELNVE